MKKKLLLLCMVFLSIFGTLATTQTPTNSTTNGSDVWYFIKGTARINTTQKVEWITGAPAGFNISFMPFSAGDAQRWKVVTNGAGIALVNKAYGTYINSDLATGTNVRIPASVTAPAAALKLVPTTQVTNGVLLLSLNTAVGASPTFTVTATDANPTFGVLSSGTVYQPILGVSSGVNYNIVFYSESETAVLTDLTAAATLMYSNTSFSNRQASSKTALNTANVAAATVRDNASSTAAQNLTAINNLSAAIIAYNAATYTNLTVSSADASSEKWYVLKGQVASNYATSAGVGGGVTTSALASTLANSGLQLWKIVPNGTAGYALKNKSTGEYLNTDLGFLSGNPTDVAITTKAAAPTNSVVFNVSTATGAPTNSVWIENINAYPGLSHNYFRLNDGASSTVRDVVNATTNVSWLLVDLKGDLNTAITTATSYLPSAASLNPGNGTASAQITLTTAISTATTVYNNASSTNSDLLTATTTLNTAITTYKAAIIVPTISSADASNEKWYFFQGLRPTNSYMTTNGIGQGITSVTVIPDDTQLWKIVPNTNSPGTGYALVNKANGGYLNTDVTNAGLNAQATTIATMPLINVVFNLSDVLTSGVARFWVENAGTTSASTTGFTFRLHAGITNVLNWYGNRYDNSGWLLMDYSVSLKGFLNTAITAANVVVNDATIPVGTALGQYPSDAKPTLTTAIATAQAVYDNASATDAAVQAAIANLNTAVFICKGRRGDAVVSTAGTPRWFVIRNLFRTDAGLVKNQVISANGVAEGGGLKYETQNNTTDQLWRFEASASGGVKIINAARPTLGIQKFTYNNPQKLAAAANASGYVVDILGSGYKLTDDLGNSLHAYNGNLITYNDGAGTATNWAIEPATIFVGATDNNWSTATNWSDGLVPTAGTNVTIFSDKTVLIDPTTTATCNNLAVAGSLTIQSSAAGTGSLLINGTSTGSVSCQRYMTGGSWHLVSPTAIGGSVSTFIQDGGNAIPVNLSGNYGMMDYNETTNGWSPYFTTATVGNFTAGKGYGIRRSGDGVVTFIGTLTSGTRNVSVVKAGLGWNLIGNPYTSAIHMNDAANISANFLRSNAIAAANLDPSYACIYVWDVASNSYNILGNASYAGRDLGFNVFAPGQAFFVKAAAAGTLVFNKNMQVSQAGSSFKAPALTTDWPGITLTATGAATKSSAVIAFNENMTLGLDPTYDAGLLRGANGLSLYTRLLEDNGVDFAVQCLPENYTNLVIPVGVSSNAEGKITFSAQAVNLPANCRVVLEDRTANTLTPLTDGTTYETTVSAGETTVGRFYIHTAENTVTGTSGLNAGINSLNAYTVNDKIIIEGKIDDRAAIATLYDLQGLKVFVHSLQKGSLNTLSCPAIMKGVYLLTIQQYGETVTRRLVKK